MAMLSRGVISCRQKQKLVRTTRRSLATSSTLCEVLGSQMDYTYQLFDDTQPRHC